MNCSKALGNLPANICTPTYLAQTARKMEKASSKLSSKILSEDEMKKLGMGALVSVTAGTEEPADLPYARRRHAERRRETP